MSLVADWQVGQAGLKASLGLNVREWDNVFWQYRQPRSDKDTIASIEISPKAVTIFGLHPIVLASWLRRQSNIARYEIDSTDLYTGFAASF